MTTALLEGWTRSAPTAESGSETTTKRSSLEMTSMRMTSTRMTARSTIRKRMTSRRADREFPVTGTQRKPRQPAEPVLVAVLAMHRWMLTNRVRPGEGNENYGLVWRHAVPTLSRTTRKMNFRILIMAKILTFSSSSRISPNTRRERDSGSSQLEADRPLLVSGKVAIRTSSLKLVALLEPTKIRAT